MRKLAIVLSFLFLLNCSTFQKAFGKEEGVAEPILATPAEEVVVEQSDCSECETVSVVDENGNEVKIPLDKLKDTTELAEKYVALVKGKKIKLTDVVVKKVNENLVVMDLRLDDNLVVTVKMDVTSEELKELRALMKKLETAQPIVTYKRLEGDNFEFTFHIADEAKYSVVVQVTNLRSQWSWGSYMAGVGTMGLIVWLVSLL